MTKAFKWLTMVIVFAMGITYVALVTKSALDNLIYPQREQPIIIENVWLETTFIKPGDKLSVVISGSIMNPRCSHIYLLGSIIYEQNKIVQIDKIVELNKGSLNDLLVNRIPVTITPPALDAGRYQFRVEIHEICGSQSYIILAPLTPFTVGTTK